MSGDPTPGSTQTQRVGLPERAREFARRAHEGQTRRDGSTPYVDHPTRVVTVLEAAGYGEHALAAAYLHDVVEKTSASVADVEASFGPEVARLVEALSDDRRVEPYEARKDEHRARIEAAGPEAAAIFAADKLSNLRELRTLYADEGEAIESRLKAPLDVRIQVWMDDLRMLAGAVPDLPFLPDLEAELYGLRADRAAGKVSDGPAGDEAAPRTRG